jgi:hypothetical protein
MQRMLALALTGLVALALIGIGIGALAAPGLASRQFGIVVPDPRALAFLRAMGVRDLVLGVLLLLLAAADRRELLALGLAASVAVAVLDLTVVARDRPPGAARGRRGALLLHAGGALGLLALALAVALGD